MTFRKAIESDIPRIAALIGREQNGPLSNPPAAVAAQIKRDIDAGPFEWILAETGDNLTVGRIAMIPAPPIYDLKGLAGVVLGTWHSEGADIELFDRHLRDRGAAMLVIDSARGDTAKRAQLESLGYIATTHYMLKSGIVQQFATPSVRAATEADIPALVAFNREGRARLYEANPAFWTSHPEAEMRFGFWMKMSLTMHDRTIFVSEHDGQPNGFLITQPPSPVQVPITLDETKIGVIDDFHASSFGASLINRGNPFPASALILTAEADFTKRGRTAAMAICPAAWPAKRSRLEEIGYKTQHTWFTHPA